LVSLDAVASLTLTLLSQSLNYISPYRYHYVTHTFFGEPRAHHCAVGSLQCAVSGGSTDQVMWNMRQIGPRCCLWFFKSDHISICNSKRSISEVQLMHNVREHKEMLERQDWLQLKLNNILIPSLNDSQKEQKGKNNGPSIRRLRKGEGPTWIRN